MHKRDRDFVCGLLVDFADGQAGRSDLISTGSRETCLQAAQELIKAQVPGNRHVAAAHIVIVARDEWDECYAVSNSQPSGVARQTAMAASRAALELIASQLRARLSASDAAQIVATAFVQRGAAELINHIGKDLTKAHVQKLLDETQDGPPASAKKANVAGHDRAADNVADHPEVGVS